MAGGYTDYNEEKKGGSLCWSSPGNVDFQYGGGGVNEWRSGSSNKMRR